MVPNINMLGATIKDLILREIDATLIITVDNSGL
jgi:hypothetical protein